MTVNDRPDEAGKAAEWPLPFIPSDAPADQSPPQPGEPQPRGGVSWYVPLVGYCLMAFALLMAVGSAAAGALDNFALTGSGTVVSESRPVDAFTEIAVEGTGLLIVTQGDREALTIEAEDNVLPTIDSTVRDGRLTIDHDWGGSHWFTSFRPRKGIVYRVTVKDLNLIHLSGATAMQAADLRANWLEVRLSGAGEATIERLTATELVASLTGAATLRASGTVQRQEITLSGAGEYQAEDLASKDATVTVSGAGEAEVRVSDTLNVRVSGPGEVHYIGDPRVTKQVSGPGEVRQRSRR